MKILKRGEFAGHTITVFKVGEQALGGGRLTLELADVDVDGKRVASRVPLKGVDTAEQLYQLGVDYVENLLLPNRR
ncbi:hypothetical protein ACFSR9_08860 [Deinococcus taklimakanensis]|uniref:Uncharacterized protein n=1 Tax=Deinococcus taklimakanensis TaxID=536443 RepID=A0ABW5P2S2_9DEIO